MQLFRKALVLLSVFLPASLVAAEPPVDAVPQEVIAAAEEALQYFLSTIPEAERFNLGLEGTNRDFQSTLGEPFRTHKIKPEDILRYRPGDDIASMVHPMNMWNFPVISAGKARCILTMAQVSGEWKPANLGRAWLANEITAVSQFWRKSQGYRLRYVRIYQGSIHVFMVTTATTSRIVPLRSTAVALGFAEKTMPFLYPPVDSAAFVKATVPKVKANLGIQ